METPGKERRMKLRRFSYPWLSSLGAIAIIAWQLGLQLGLILEWKLPMLMRRDDALLLATAALIPIVIFDIWRYIKSRQRVKAQFRQYQDQIGELFDSKRELGTRARTYSDHADKLKMFISERLLETIEYDEKFLHFKNIASEVRHNGVISYDKAQTALKRARQESDADGQQQYQDAADGLLYLWDLLDLSTTDNIALHVANQIYDCEEHYFQSLLSEDDTEENPFEPAFMMSQALRRALLPITDDPDELGLNGAWKCPGRYQDDKFNIHLRTDNEMLGNPNHMVLLIENLLNNALFYAQQKEHKSRYGKVAISLAHRNGEVEFQVYNRGPRIKDSEKDKIYQLGFSSRRIREHHGKGLGLYFVNEIAKGFEGTIGFDNIDNQEDEYSLSVKLDNGEIEKHQVRVIERKGKPLCSNGDGDDSGEKKRDWSFSAPIVSIEIGSRSTRKPQLISELGQAQASSHFDDRDPQMPRWVLEINNRKRSSSLKFQPLNLRGVRFTARFPTANTRLENQD